MSFNPCAYVQNNPVNYTDPTGEFICGGLCIAAAWGVGLFALGGGIDVGSQMLLEDKSFNEVNWLRAGISGATTVIGGGAGFASATLIKGAGLTGGRALLAAGVANAVDFGVGAAADHYLLGDSWGTAVAGNAIGFGIGEAAGFFGKGAFRIGGDLLADTRVGNALADSRIGRALAGGANCRNSFSASRQRAPPSPPQTAMWRSPLSRSATRSTPTTRKPARSASPKSPTPSLLQRHRTQTAISTNADTKSPSMRQRGEGFGEG